MGSKYERLFKDLPRELGTEPKFQALVEAKKAEIPPMNPTELATLYRQIRAEKDQADEALTEINVRLIAVEQKMWAAFELADQTEVGFADGYSVAIVDKARVKIENRDEVLAWMKDNGFERLLSVHGQTLSTLTLERLVEGLEPPDGVSVSTYKRTSFTKK